MIGFASILFQLSRCFQRNVTAEALLYAGSLGWLQASYWYIWKEFSDPPNPPLEGRVCEDYSVETPSTSDLQLGGYDTLHLAWATGITVNDSVIQSASTDPNSYARGGVSDTGLTLDNDTFLNIDSSGAGKDTLFLAIAGFSVQRRHFLE